MLLNFCFVGFSFGLSLTVYYPTEYYYFKDTMKVKDPDLFYGLSWAFLCGSGVVSSLFGSYYADSTKNLRGICLVTNALNVIGNIMYVLYYSPYLVLFGQLLVGTAAARSVASVGEISRVYEAKDLTQKLSLLGVFSTFGSLLGPCTTYVFKSVNTEISGWKLNVNNMVGITMASLFFIQLIINYFTLQNVSKVYNIKTEARKNFLLEIVGDEDASIYNSSDEDKSFCKNYIIALSALFRSKQVLFLYALCLFTSYTRTTIRLLQPIKSQELLSWKEIDLSKFSIVSVCSGSIPTAIVLTLISKRVNDFFLLLFALLTNLIALVLMGIFSIIWKNYTLGYVTLYANGIIAAMSTTGYHIILRSMLAKFVPENIQTVTEAIRNASFELAYTIAGIGLKFPSNYFIQSIFGMAIILSFAIVWYLADGKTYRNIKMITLHRKISQRNIPLTIRSSLDDNDWPFL